MPSFNGCHRTARMGCLTDDSIQDKSGKNREGASIALFTYPVLQAADVLLYQATHVPVGDDQKHIWNSPDIAQKSTRFRERHRHFTLPDPIIPKQPHGS